ncbi:translation initiation factor IF-3 [Candidatus Kaiserbacteria bacterium RIFCSPHIGHO2_01_FULL_54_36]|uniref:Translation initiation factor IF-3 n=1 Tax=Candidatus Kaiserbacteria bacterium RIFCSPHIGHO2_01_FULL_54_36 TaxID=1798482 RepID=A0A1F6CJN8_9BACT|nr:MAG: translation initiation factor IF-3 [Candidatus Kaiserbacteria bacterium RIFCSPHIGHO2_01_FULL_54_36]OGG75657.1 MAG: translation initiation factor IF-3 [Candidatus Kaiserbacteria bacterium RIFCSPLOWO2_01_FULL_54_22]
MGFTKYTSQAEKERARMNEGIRAPEVRALGPEGENFGILPIREALAKAQELGLDLIEISPNAQPPVCKITDYGKFKYEQKKKDKEVKSKAHVTETKVTQVKIGTSERDMQIKAGKAAAWLKEGHRVRVDLFLWGRYKYMEFEFLKERLERFLSVIPEGFKIAEAIQKGPKGLSVSIERDPSKKISVPKEKKILTSAPPPETL